MIFSYRTRQALKRIAVAFLVVLLVLTVILVFWFMWLERFVVYTADGKAVLDLSLSATFPPGEEAVAPTAGPTVPIYYNDGENVIITTTELTQMQGYYIDEEALMDIANVRSQLDALPAGTPVMLDVKSIYGNFFYSSSVSSRRNSDLNIGAVDALIADITASNLYVIARLPALRDYYFGLNNVPYGLPTAGGYLWMDDDYCYWLNPASEGTITYLMQIITELRGLGFDEVVLSDFYFPATNDIVFTQDKTQALSDTASLLVKNCATASFAVSFTGQSASFPLPEGRCRLYIQDAAAADAASIALESGLADPAVYLVFVTEFHDTRFDDYSVLRPLAGAH